MTPLKACRITSYPGEFFKGPVRPKPEILQWINRLLRARRLSASMASRSATPVPKLSMATSADLASSCTRARPFSDFILIAMLRLLRLALRNTVPSPGAGKGGHPRVSSPCPTASTLITSAPRSPRYCAHSGPARTFDRSRTLTPSRGLATTFTPLRACASAQSGCKQTAEIGGKTFLRHQEIVGRSALRLAELKPPAPGDGVGLGKAGSQQLLYPHLRLTFKPRVQTGDRAIKGYFLSAVDAKANARQRLREL